ncbi:MAG: hypothetical protein ACRC5G_01450, partial [Cetobacterium sp.]
TLNQTIDLVGSVTIAPGGFVEFTVTGKLKDNLIGKFTNTSTYDNNNNKSVDLNPVPTTIAVKKKLTKLNGVAFTTGMTYNPGDSVEYTVEIENTGSSFFNNLRIGDNTDAIVTSLTGDANGKALENVSISAALVSNTVSKPVLTDIKPVPGDTPTNLQVEVDFAPKDKIVYTITGNIVKSAIGVIPANIAVVNNQNYSSDPINPKLPLITSKKELISPADKIYGPNEVVEYKLTIENTGEGYGNDIKIVDKIGEIKTTLLNGTLGQAFVNWTITTSITHSKPLFNGQTIIQNTLVDNSNIDTEADIAPSAKIEITIKATTSSLAAGTIINTATINGEDKPSPPINPRIATVKFYKLPLVDGVTTYTPGGDAGFRLVLQNESTNAIARDIDLTDIISGIKVLLADGTEGPALQPGWVLEIVALGNAANYSTSGIGAGGDIAAGKVTIGPGGTLVVRIKGKANATAVGDIVNTANAKYNGTDLGPKTVTLTTLPGVGQLTKAVNKVDYTPGGKLIYTLTVKNTGSGYLNDVTIVDDLYKVTTQLADGTVGPAFASGSITQLNAMPATFVKDSAYADGYKAKGDIAPGGTATIILEVTVAPLAAGKITNIADILDSAGNSIAEDKADNTTTVNPLPAIVQILKTVDKSIYVSGDTLTYNITVGNTGTGWANGILVEDNIAGIMADIGGVSTTAFTSWTVSAKPSAGSGTVVLGTNVITASTPLTADVNLSQRVSLAPMSGIEFTIVAKLKANTTTDIKNKASYKYDPDKPNNPTTEKPSNEVVTKPKATELTIVKKQNNIREALGYSENPQKYWLGDSIEYQIVVKNGVNAITSFDIIDNIQSILVGGSGGNNIPAYSEWSVKSVTYSGGSTTAPISIQPAGTATQPSGLGVLVKTKLDANETVTVTIAAKITTGDENNPNFPQSVIKNTASITANGKTDLSNEVIFTPYPPVLERTKVITSIGGKPYDAATNATYSPGDVVVYTIGIKNTGNGVADNITVKDDLSTVVTELAGGSTGPAFSNWIVTLVKSPAAKVDGTYPLSKPSIINDIVDLGPDKFVNFVVTATVATNAIGTISPNIAVINGEDKVTPPIPPKVPTAPALTKKILVGADKLDKSEYTAGGTIVYAVSVTNPNDKLWLNDVNILDSISTITAVDLAGNTVTAFKPNWTIAMTNLKPATIFTVGGYPKTNVNLNETMDLAPLDTVTFKITAVVNDNIVGKILNSTSGTYKKNKNETPSLGPVTVESETKTGTAKITKVPFQEFYSPNGSIGFDISIENTSDTYLIDNLKLTDIISAVKASKIGSATQVPAFKPGWTITYQVVGNPLNVANTNATAIPATGDINAVNLDIGKSTKINIQIRGTAEDGIYGDVTNSAKYEYPDSNPVKEVTATVKPKDPIVTLVKNVNVPEYGPTDTILYTLELSNTGTGAAIGVTLEDKIGTIITDLTGTPATGLAFTAWERELTSVPPTSKVTNETTTGDTYKAILDIAPGDKVIITLKGTLNPNAYGKILNIANGTYKNGKNEILPLTDDAETVGKAPNLFLVKEIDKNLYQDEDTLVFKVLLQNAGLGWGNNIPVRDSISTIVDGIVGPAFASWTIDIVKSKAISSVSTNPESANPPTPANTDLNVLVDIAPQSQVAFVITAKLKPNVSSQIVNKAYMTKKPGDPETPSNPVIADPIKGSISMLKSVEESKYTPGEKLTYIIEVRNNANILAKDVVIKDALNSIKVLTNKGIQIVPFSSWKIVSVTPSSVVLPVTVPASITPAIGVSGTTDVEVKTNIKANETIKIKVEGIVSLGNEADGVPTGILENKATATYDGKEIFNTVRNTPGDPLVTVNKSIKTLAGKPFTGQKYDSGDELVYEISVENSGAGMASDVSIKDAITTMKTELAGGITGPAFSTWSVVITKIKATTLIEPATVPKDSDISLIADIDRGDKVVITITATINPKAVGIIPKNVVTVGEVEKETPKIDPEKGLLEFTKEITKGWEYTQGGTIEYKLTITNPNKTFVNDVSFTDEISKIKAKGVNEGQVPAFKSWTVKRTDNGTGSEYSQAAEITGDIKDNTIDISPKDVIVYTIVAIVNEDVVGDIVNTGYLEYLGPEGVVKEERSVTSKNTPGTVTIVKEPISPNYLPNGEIGFTIVVTNTSKTSVANNVTIKDSISTILADKVGGGTVPAFQAGWTITAVLDGSTADKAVSNITALEGIEAGKDINALVDLGKDTKVTITIKGKAATNIYGDILNLASFDYPEAKDEAGKTGKDDAVIKNTPS